MIFIDTFLKGAYLIDLEKRGDERGFFARAFCEREFGELGLVTRFVQVNNSLSARKGTLRGMHYQLTPKAETKVVRCIRGALYDAILDLREWLTHLWPELRRRAVCREPPHDVCAQGLRAWVFHADRRHRGVLLCRRVLRTGMRAWHPLGRPAIRR